MLHEFLTSQRDEIIARTKAKVAARGAPRATAAELTHGIPLFFDQLVDTLKDSRRPSDAMIVCAAKHGDEMLRQGFSVGQVVYDYGDLCQAVTELAFEFDAPICVEEFQTLNRCLDDAIAQAVTAYGRLREQAITDQGTERMGTLAHELRNHLNTAMLSFGILKRGIVSVQGSTGALLGNSLEDINDLIDRSLAEVRLESTVERRETIRLAAFVEEIEIGATIEARESGHRLTVDAVDFGVVFDADRQLLAAAVANLLQNAFKFTRGHGHVWLRTRATADRVFIEVEDECGGLTPEQSEMLFRPYHQHSANRSGLGLGLSISRKAVRQNGGEIRVRNLPGRGCIFSVELPRMVDTAKPNGGVVATLPLS